MSWFEKVFGTMRSTAAKEAGKYAAKKAIQKAKGRVEALGEDLRQFADGEPAEEEPGTQDDEVVERVRAQAQEEHRARKQARVDREQQARDELAALKAAYAEERESD